jgi:hypothetical protein
MRVNMQLRAIKISVASHLGGALRNPIKIRPAAAAEGKQLFFF